MTVKPMTLLLTVLGLVMLGVTGFYLKHDAPLAEAQNASLSIGSRNITPKRPHHAAPSKLHDTTSGQSGTSPNASHTTVTTSGNCKKTVTTKTTKTAAGGTATVSNTSVTCSDGGQNSTTNSSVNVQSDTNQSSTSGNSSGTSGTATNTDHEDFLVN